VDRHDAERLRVAVAQMDVTLGDVEANTATALRFIADARSRQVQLLVFPELALSGYSLDEPTVEGRLPMDADAIRALAAAAGDTALVVGLAELTPTATYNSAALLQRGDVAFVQRKLTLPTYDRFSEKQRFAPGDRLRPAAFAGTRIAVLICNDAWHPGLAFLAIQDGAELMVVPANSATPGRGAQAPTEPAEWERHWSDVLRFHARILQTFVIYANRVGQEGDVAFYGGSMIIGPDGQALAAARRYAAELIVAELDLSALRALRRRFPLQQDSRLELITQESARLSAAG
jgi:predicted amidohydrolase